MGPAREMPASALAAYAHLCWKVGPPQPWGGGGGGGSVAVASSMHLAASLPAPLACLCCARRLLNGWTPRLPFARAWPRLPGTLSGPSPARRLLSWISFPKVCTELTDRVSPPPPPHHPPPPSQVNFLLISAFGIVLPMRLYLPCQLAALLLSLRATTVRCRQECGVQIGAAAAGVAGAAAATCGGSTEPAVAAGVCQAGAGAASVVQYYTTAAGLIQRLGPSQLWRLSAWWRQRRRATGAGCLGACFAVHSWLQVSGTPV